MNPYPNPPAGAALVHDGIETRTNGADQEEYRHTYVTEWQIAEKE